MGDVSGQSMALTALTPIHPGREIALMEHINAFPTRERSPFHRVAHTHFARLVVICDLIYEGPPQQREHLSCPYLLFTSTFDSRPFGSPSYDAGLRDYLEVLRTGLGPEADGIWGDCVGYPGSADAAAFARYIAHNRLPSTFFVSFYPDATVEDVRSSMTLRAEITRFAIEAQDLSPAQKLATFRKRFLGAGGNGSDRSPRRRRAATADAVGARPE